MPYTGLMIGGPKAGEWFTHEYPKIEFVENGRLIKLPGEGVMSVDYNGPIATTFVHVSDATAGAFWVPEGKTVAWAVQELVGVYREVQRLPAESFPADN